MRFRMLHACLCPSSRAVVQEIDATEYVTDWTNRLGPNLKFVGVTILQASQTMFANLAGDSEGMWIGEDNKAVALNFGGGEDSVTALAIPIRRIVAFFQTHLNDAGLVGIDNAAFWR